jgi:hypothetical protein
MNNKTAAAILLMVVIVAVAATWFFFSQTNNLKQTSTVRITSFSVDPEGWKSGGGLGYSCPFDITFQNVGADDVKLWLKVTMYRLGEFVGVGKQGVPLAVSLDLHGFNLSAGEVRNFQGVMHWVPNTVNTSEGHPFGATYMAQVFLENSIHASDTATVTEPFSTFLFVAVTIVTVIAIAILIYFKKRKH